MNYFQSSFSSGSGLFATQSTLGVCIQEAELVEQEVSAKKNPSGIPACSRTNLQATENVEQEVYEESGTRTYSQVDQPTMASTTHTSIASAEAAAIPSHTNPGNGSLFEFLLSLLFWGVIIYWFVL